MSRTNLQTLLERLGQQLNVQGLQLDDDGYCLVRIDEKIDLSIEFDEETQSAVLTAACGVLPEENRAGMLQELLDANYYWAGSGGATFSTNSRQGTVHLQFREPADRLDQSRLEELLQALINGAEFWIDRLNRQADVAAPGTVGDFRPPLIHLV